MVRGTGTLNTPVGVENGVDGEGNSTFFTRPERKNITQTSTSFSHFFSCFRIRLFQQDHIRNSQVPILLPRSLFRNSQVPTLPSENRSFRNHFPLLHVQAESRAPTVATVAEHVDSFPTRARTEKLSFNSTDPASGSTWTKMFFGLVSGKKGTLVDCSFSNLLRSKRKHVFTARIAFLLCPSLSLYFTSASGG